MRKCIAEREIDAMVAETRRATNWTPPKCDGCGDAGAPLAPWPPTRNGQERIDLFCQPCHELREATDHDATWGES